VKVIIVEPPKDIEKKIAVAAKMCYSASTLSELSRKILDSDQKAFIKKIVAIGHHSVLEHVNLSFAVEGISRVLTHQLVRHRIASYSQQSQRYVRLDDTFEYITPESIRLSRRLSMKYHNLMDQIHDMYKDYLDEGIPAEDARYILPNATETKIFVTMNLRTLLHFFNVRCCNRAQWEIRAMAIEMLKQCKKLSPIIFESSGPSCIGGNCGEGEMTCGYMASVRNKFKEML
jgi:thymidylate synthase (FAD)